MSPAHHVVIAHARVAATPAHVRIASVSIASMTRVRRDVMNVRRRMDRAGDGAPGVGGVGSAGIAGAVVAVR